MSSDLAENIGRAVLSAIQRFSGSAPSTSQTPQHLESSNAPGPSRPAVSTGIPYRSVPLPSVPQAHATRSHFEEPEELSDSDFESPVCRRRRVHHALPTTPGESEAKHQETEGCIQESENEGQQMFPYNVAEFVPIFLEEDEALEDAIQRSLLEESDRQSEVHISSAKSCPCSESVAPAVEVLQLCCCWL
ncbi:unnamed protein product [Oreochromis niloticus]|nr:unnamed protein product [Mustela putorius furo]